MEKQILTVGIEIPGLSNCYVDFNLKKSFMDADILLISTESINPSWHGWIDFSSGGGCHGISSSNSFVENINHLNKELEDFLKSGKNVFIILSKKVSYSLATGVTHPRKGERLYSTTTGSNYDFLPISIGNLTSASGKHISFSGNSLFSDFYRKFKKNLEYQLYVENPKQAKVIFTGKDKTKILGAIYQRGAGHIITLPYLSIDEDKYIEERDNKSYWTKEAIKFGETLTECLYDIDQKLTLNSEKSIAPDWVKKKEFASKRTLAIQKIIEKKNKEIEDINSSIKELNLELVEESVINDLLFEQGKPLENAVTKALTILGYEAENYDDGVLELDQIIVSPEKQRFIGECEGKDTKDINITKFRQLLESLNADFDRDEVEEKAFGILFGNPQRLEEPNKRTLDFTQKCKTGAEREKIALVKTTDLFNVVQYLREHTDEKFKKSCRDAIYNGLGKIVEFPTLPKE